MGAERKPQFRRITIRVPNSDAEGFYKRLETEEPNAFVLGENLTTPNHREAEWVADILKTDNLIVTTEEALDDSEIRSVRGFVRLLDDTEELRTARNLTKPPQELVRDTLDYFAESLEKHKRAGVPIAYLVDERSSFYRDIEGAIDPREIRTSILFYGLHGKYVRPKEIEKREGIKSLALYLPRIQSRIVSGIEAMRRKQEESI